MQDDMAYKIITMIVIFCLYVLRTERVAVGTALGIQHPLGRIGSLK